MKEINSKSAPQAIGPYSQAIIAENLIFCSGQIPLDPISGEIIEGGISEQTQWVIDNLTEVLKEVGAGLKNVIKTEVYLSDMNHFSEMNDVYRKNFIFKPYPARVTVEVSRLPKNALIEISCVACKE